MERTRRLARLVAVTAALALAVTACTSTSRRPGFVLGSGAAQSSTQPNIVFVLTDDLSMNLVRYMPHVLALQKAGTTLSDYYTVDSLCCPSRSAIFTGQYPHDDGVFTNTGSDGGYDAYNRNGDQADAFGPALQKAGYRTGFMGKYLNGYLPKDEPPPGWSEWDVTGNGYPEFGYTLNENGTKHRFGHDPQDYLTDVISGKAGSFIDSSAAAHKPFMLELATFAPHKPYTPAPRDANSYPTLKAPRTKAYDTLPTNPPSWLTSMQALSSQDETAIDDAFRKRVQSVQAVDDMIAHVEKELQAKGIAKDTYLVFSSDNGYHMGEYRLLPGKQTAFDTDVHVPLVVSGPGVPAGANTDRLASNIDLAPTFEALAGAHIPSATDGVSLADLWHGQQPAHWQQGVLVEHHGPDHAKGDPDLQSRRSANPPSYEALRTAHGLFVRYTATGEQEYYDTTHDPDELHNLGASQVPASMRTMLAALQRCHGATQCQSAAGA